MIYGQQDQFGTPANADDLQGRLTDVCRVDVAGLGILWFAKWRRRWCLVQQFAQVLKGNET